MLLSRRSFLASTGAATLTPGWALASTHRLRAEASVTQILEGEFLKYGATTTLGFNGGTPGPTLRVRQGDEIAVTFENRTGQASSIHWHGIRIANGMDGVPGLTQKAVPNNEDFEYRFLAPDAGTYWYHSHNRSWEQVARGLYGALIVEEAVPPDVDADIVVIVDDWRLKEDAQFIDDFDSMFDFSHAGRLGNYAKIIPSKHTVREGDRVRLRLINSANARIFPIDIKGIEGKLVALDGMPLEKVEDIGTVTMAPAQRADIIGDVVSSIEFSFRTNQGNYNLGSIATQGVNPSPRDTEVLPLPPNEMVKPSREPNRYETLVMQGGAMGGQHSGDDVWAFNGNSSMPSEPWLKVNRGTTVQLSLVNETSFPHGIHLHGQHFLELDEQVGMGVFRDTTLVEARGKKSIVCNFQNPGKWLLHCHMLEHSATGMKTWIEVI